MPSLFVKLEGDKVVEACPQKIEGGIEVSATDAQIKEIMQDRFDARCDGRSILSTAAGKDAEVRKANLQKREARSLARQNETTVEKELAKLQSA